MPDATIDQIIDRLSAPFDGVVRAHRLIEARISDDAITHRIKTGRLIPIFPGVYLVGHRGLTVRRVWWACLMEAGSGSALSRRTSAESRSLVKGERPWSVTVALPPTRKPREITADVDWNDESIKLVLHRSCALPRLGVEPKHGHRLPMLSVPDTLVDVAWYAPDDFDDVFRNAEFRRLTDDRSLRKLLRPGRPGAARVRERLDLRAFGSMRFQNGFEEMGEKLFEVFGLGVPLVNTRVAVGGTPIRVDLFWPLLGLVIELDGGDAHASVGGRALDLSNEARLRAAGLDVMRFDWNQVKHRPHEIRAALVGAGYLPVGA